MKETINIRFYYNGIIAKTRMAKPLNDTFTTPLIGTDTQEAIKFKYRFAVLTGGDKQEILFVVYTPESQHE